MRIKPRPSAMVQYKGRTDGMTVWQHAIHQVTGDMAMKWTSFTPVDIKAWVQALREVAACMETSIKRKRKKS